MKISQIIVRTNQNNWMVKQWARMTFKGTLHFNINLGPKVSLDPPE